MNYLSVCSGIEAATVAWHSLGWTPVAFSEIEPFPYIGVKTMIYATYYICQEIRTLNVYEAVQAGELREAPVFMDVYSDDPVLQGRHVYEDGGWTYVGPPPKRPTPVDLSRGSVPPECAKDCKWRQTFSFDRQRNALRCEAANMVEAYRCGWNLKPGVLGGHALDYAACTYRGFTR